MATSIKVRATTKANLEKLQAKLLLHFRKKFSQQDIIEMLVSLGKKNLEKLVVEHQSLKITQKGISDLLDQSEDWGLVTISEDVDKVLYGE